MITPSDSPSAPAQYNAVPVQSADIQAPLEDLTGAVNAAGALAGAGIIYPRGPRQQESQGLMESVQGFASDGYDINAGYAGSWGADVEPTHQGP